MALISHTVGPRYNIIMIGYLKQRQILHSHQQDIALSANFLTILFYAFFQGFQWTSKDSQAERQPQYNQFTKHPLQSGQYTEVLLYYKKIALLLSLTKKHTQNQRVSIVLTILSHNFFGTSHFSNIIRFQNFYKRFPSNGNI